MAILKEFARLFGIPDESPLLNEEHEPVYGLPKSEIEAWLARNDNIRLEYEAALQQRQAALRALQAGEP